MHKGIFVGKDAENQPKRILILGESHHWSKEDWVLQPGETEEQAEERRRIKAETYSTECVLKQYLDNYTRCAGGARDSAYRFFDQIVRAFKVDPEKERDAFWNKVYFGNYIDVLCGVRDSAAANFLRVPENRGRCNSKLFAYIEENKIDIVLCFSRKVYNKLPPLERGDYEIKGNKLDSHRIDQCVYCSGERELVSVPLSKSVTVYGLKHPSQGFSYRRYQNKLNGLL